MYCTHKAMPIVLVTMLIDYKYNNISLLIKINIGQPWVAQLHEKQVNK